LREDKTIEKDKFGNFEITSENLEKLKKIILDCYSRLFGNKEFAIIKGFFEEYALRFELSKEEERKSIM